MWITCMGAKCVIKLLMLGFSPVCRHVGGNGGPELLRAVPPQVLSAILTSPQLVGKKNVGNITELFQLLQVII